MVFNSDPERSPIPANRLFHGMPEELVREIERGIEAVRYSPEQVIFEEGHSGDCLFLVQKGTVRISKAGRGESQETLGFIEEGNFFGEMALIDGHPRSARATAVNAVLLGRVDEAAFERILQRAPRSVQTNFLRTVVERLRGVNAHYISELMRTERLSLVGTMANSIVHDLKNPIHCISSCAELLAKKWPDPGTAEFLQIIKRATENMDDMIQELLDFAQGKSSIKMERTSPKCIFAELDPQLTPLVTSEIELVREGADSAAPILADVGRFARMLLNLMKNSVEAMPHGGVLWLKVREQEQNVVFRVSDTGCGIDPDLQTRIFEPFVTFGKSKGTGLGMAIVKSVVEAHRGAIELTSELGAGTTVEISVPRAR